MFPIANANVRTEARLAGWPKDVLLFNVQL